MKTFYHKVQFLSHDEAVSSYEIIKDQIAGRSGIAESALEHMIDSHESYRYSNIEILMALKDARATLDECNTNIKKYNKEDWGLDNDLAKLDKVIKKYEDK